MSKGILKDRMTSEEFRAYNDKRNQAANSKYGAIPTQTADGEKFRSHLEATYFNRLKLLKSSGEITNIEREVRYELTVNGFFICAYMMDFRVTWADGRIDYIDCKSKPTMTPVYAIKKKLMEACHGITLREVFE